jgi:galactokinase/mevalonate kinase-like predicted kinase
MRQEGGRMTRDEIVERLETAKTDILGKRLENAWQILDRLARDIENEGVDDVYA